MNTLQTKLYQWLRASEKYTKIDMVYLTKNGFWVTFGQVMASVISLLLIIAFANLLPKETYGLYRYILSLAGILNIFTLTGMNSAISRAVAGGNEGILRTLVRYQLKWNVLMLVGFLVLSAYYFFNGDTIFATAFFILGIFTPATLSLNTYGAYLDGKRAFRMASTASILSTLVYTLGMIGMIFISDNVLLLIGTYACITFATTAFFYFYTVHRFNLPLSTDTDTLSFGKKLTITNLITPIASQADKIILAHFWGPAEVAIYVLAQTIPARATALIKNIVGVGAPKFAIQTPKKINKIFYTRILQGALFGACATVGYIFIAPYVFAYILPQYLDSVLFSQILAFAFIVAIPNRYVSLLLVSQKFSKAIFINNIIQNIVRILLYAGLGIYGGILGLVLAHVSAAYVGIIINVIVWRFHTRTT